MTPNKGNGDIRRLLTVAAEVAAIVAAIVAVVVAAFTLWPEQQELRDARDAQESSPVIDIICGDTDSFCVAGEGFSVEECSMRGVLNAWGLDPQLDALLIEVVGTVADCQVWPNDLSTAAGGAVGDIRAAEIGIIADVLRECARAAGEPVVPCSESHEVEFVGASFAVALGADPASICEERGRKYAATTYDADSRVNYGTVEFPGGSARCVLKLEHGSSTTSLRKVPQ